MIVSVLVFLKMKLNPAMPLPPDVVPGSIPTIGLNVTSVVTEPNGKDKLAFVTVSLVLMMLVFTEILLKPLYGPVTPVIAHLANLVPIKPSTVVHSTQP